MASADPTGVARVVDTSGDADSNATIISNNNQGRLASAEATGLPRDIPAAPYLYDAVEETVVEQEDPSSEQVASLDSDIVVENAISELESNIAQIEELVGEDLAEEIIAELIKETKSELIEEEVPIVVNTVEEETSFSFGEDTEATGINAIAIGTSVRASGERSFAQGFETEASGRFASARGFKSKAAGRASLASGFRALAQGDTAQALGYGTIAQADYSSALGYRSKSAGIAAVAIGSGSEADADSSIAIGTRAITQTSASNSVAIGNFVEASGQRAFVIGSGQNDEARLNNSISDSLAIGFNSDQATLFVGPSEGLGTSGNIAIGHSEPKAKLDVAGDALISGSLSARVLRLAELTTGKLLTTNEQGEIVTIDTDDLDLLKLDDTNSLNLNQDAQISSNSSLTLNSEKVNITGLLSLSPLEKAPLDPRAGDLYYDKTGALCIYLEVADAFENSYWDKITGLEEAYCNDDQDL